MEIASLLISIFNAAAASAYLDWIKEQAPALLGEVSMDDTRSAAALRDLIREKIGGWKFEAAEARAKAASAASQAVTGWRIEGTLREFPKFPPVNLWFRYPVHVLDDSGILGDLSADGGTLTWHKAQRGRKEKADLKRRTQEEKVADAVANCCAGEPPTVKDLTEWFSEIGETDKEDTVRKWLKKFGFRIDKDSGGKVFKESADAQDAL